MNSENSMYFFSVLIKIIFIHHRLGCITILGSWGCCSKLPQTYCVLKTTHIYSLTVLVDRSLKLVSWAKVKVWAGTHSQWRLQCTIPSLHLPGLVAARHSWACGSIIPKFKAGVFNLLYSSAHSLFLHVYIQRVSLFLLRTLLIAVRAPPTNPG